MLSHLKYRNSNITRIEKIKILCRLLNVKNKIALNIMSEKILNALLYSVLENINQLHMLSHVNTEIPYLSESKKI